MLSIPPTMKIFKGHVIYLPYHENRQGSCYLSPPPWKSSRVMLSISPTMKIFKGHVIYPPPPPHENLQGSCYRSPPPWNSSRVMLSISPTMKIFMLSIPPTMKNFKAHVIYPPPPPPWKPSRLMLSIPPHENLKAHAPPQHNLHTILSNACSDLSVSPNQQNK